MRDDRTWTIGAVWGAVLGAMLLGCGLCGPSGQPTGNCEEDKRPANNPASVESGDLQVTLGYMWKNRRLLVDSGAASDTEPEYRDTAPRFDVRDGADVFGPGPSDSGVVDTGGRDTWTGPSDSGTAARDAGWADVDSGLGSGDDRSGFIPLTEGRTMAVHSGFQGGYHIYPAVRVKGVDSNNFEGTVKFEVRDSTTGGSMTHSACTKREATTGNWDRTSEGWVYSGIRAVLQVDDSELRGETQTLVADVEIDGEREIVEQEVTFE